MRCEYQKTNDKDGKKDARELQKEELFNKIYIYIKEKST